MIIKFNETNVQPDEILGDLLNEALELDIKVETKQEKTISKDKFDLIIKGIINDYKPQYHIIPALAVIGLFSTLQAGGINNSKRSNVKITVGSISFESKKINSQIIKHCRSVTPRQVAKIFANQILRCAIKYNIPGNAYIYITRHYPQLLNVDNRNEHEKYWCSDFQTDNPECPEYIRTALKARYNDKFGKKSK